MDTRRWREKETQSVARTGVLRGSAQPLWQGGWRVLETWMGAVGNGRGLHVVTTMFSKLFQGETRLCVNTPGPPPSLDPCFHKGSFLPCAQDYRHSYALYEEQEQPPAFQTELSNSKEKDYEAALWG